jgi:hypothetical protein
MSQTKKTTDWLGREKEEHFDDNGQKVGETRFSKTWLGNPRQEHFDAENNKIGETRAGSDLLGRDRAEHFDSNHNRVGTSRDERDWIGRPVQRHYDSSGTQVGETHRREDWIGRSYKEHQGEYFKAQSGCSSPLSSSSDYPASGQRAAESYVNDGSRGRAALITIAGVVALGLFILFIHHNQPRVASDSAANVGTAIPVQPRAPMKPVTTQRTDVFHIVVNSDETVGEMVEAGRYDHVNSDISDEHFPVSNHGSYETEIRLVNFNVQAYISSDVVKNRLDAMGLRPANLDELLAFGATYPNRQRKNRIVALGSMWHRTVGDYLVPYIGGTSTERSLGLYWSDWAGWQDEFAAVRKSTDPPAVVGDGAASSAAEPSPKPGAASPTISSTFHVTVDYDLTVDEMAKAGKFDWVAMGVDSRHFSTSHHGTSEVEMVLVQFDRNVGTEEVLHELGTRDLRPADALELLAFDASYPETGRTFPSPIVAFGSVHSQGSGEALLIENGVLARRLDSTAFSWYSEWGTSYRFAAVREQSENMSSGKDSR